MRLREIGTLARTVQEELAPRRVRNVPEQPGPSLLAEAILPVMKFLCLEKGGNAMVPQRSCDCQLK